MMMGAGLCGCATAMRSRSAAGYLLFFAGLSLLLSLGGWQWRRGVEKAAIETVLENSNDHYITINRAPPNWDAMAYRQVRLQGRWLDDRNFLLANRIHNGRPGHEVFTPFQLRDGAMLLINRGWIATEAEPNPAPPNTEARGQLYPPQKGFTLGAPWHAPPPGQAQWPKVIQYFDAPALSAALGSTLQPAALALDPGHPAAFTPIWQPYIITATRHFAYAAQWWGLAATLLVFGVIWRRRSVAGRMR